MLLEPGHEPLTAPQIYLQRRKVALPPNVLRNSFYMSPKNQGFFFRMMAEIVSPATGKRLGFHVTNLSGSGEKIKVGGAERRTPGLTADKDVGIIKLVEGVGRAARYLCVAEGVETSLSLATILNGKHPTIWSCVNDTNMAKLPVLDDYDGLLVGVDIEPSGAGVKAATEVATRWSAAGKSVSLCWPIPPEGVTKIDLNDVAQIEGGPVEGINYRIEKFELPDEPAAPTDKGVSLDDFRAYMPMHNYIFMPARDTWPGSSVDARIGSVLLRNAEGKPLSDRKGKPVRIPASLWLDKNRPVEQMTWAPGESMLIEGRLIAEGGWIERPGVTCFNLYRPPTIVLGDAALAAPWLDHVRKLYPDDADHIVKWCAARVQRPQDKINHNLVLMGLQGIGKDSLLQPVKQAVGPWNFTEISPQHLLGQFNGFLKSVILRVNEARDLGDVDRYAFYDHMKTYAATPPDTLRVDEKNLREYTIPNCVGVVITANDKDSLYLPADDRRHYVAWSNLTKEDFDEAYWKHLWGWYDEGGDRHVAAYLAGLCLADFNPKAPPPKTPVFWQIVTMNRPSEDAELDDVIDEMGTLKVSGSKEIVRPKAVTLSKIVAAIEARGGRRDLHAWLTDRKNRRAIPHRLERCGYVSAQNHDRKDGLWIVSGERQVIYVQRELSVAEQHSEATAFAAAEDKAAKEMAARLSGLMGDENLKRKADDEPAF